VKWIGTGSMLFGLLWLCLAGVVLTAADSPLTVLAARSGTALFLVGILILALRHARSTRDRPIAPKHPAERMVRRDGAFKITVAD